MNTRIILIIAALVVAGCILRCYKLTYQSLWYDEIHTVLRSGPEVSIPSIIGYAENSAVDQPPVFFLYTHFILNALSVNDMTVRLGSVLIGVLAIPVMFFLGREIVNSETGIFAAVLTTVNYFHIYHSQEARFYTMLFLLSAVSYLFMIRAFKYVRIIDFLLYSVFTVLLLYTHYFGMVVFAVQVLTFVVLAFYRWSNRRFILYGFLSGLLSGLAFLPWLSIVLKHSEVGSFWIRKPTWYFMFDYFYNYFGKDILQTTLFAILTFLFIRQYVKKDFTNPQSRQIYFILAMWLLISYLIPYIRSIVSTPILHMRYMIISLPAWILIFSGGWSTIANKKWRIGIMVTLIVISVVNLVFFRKYYVKISKQQMREVASVIKDKNDQNHPVFSSFYEYYQYYFQSETTILPADTSLISKHDQFWLLQLQSLSPDELTQELELFEDKYTVAERHNFHGATAILLKRKNE